MEFENLLKNNTFIGIVEENQDPDRKQRIKVRVPYLHSTEQNIPTEALPWAHPKRDNNGLSFQIPDINKVINITFPDGNLHMPLYENAEHLNINLQRKIEELTEEEYQKFIALIYNHNTQIYVDLDGLNLIYKFNQLLISDNGIQLKLKNNNSIIKFGGDEADQAIINGNNYFNWMDKFIEQLYTAYIGNLGAPVIPDPAFVAVLAQYPGLKTTKFLSKNVFTVDNGKVENKRFDVEGQIGDNTKIQSSDGSLSFNSETGLSSDDYNESKIIPQREEIDYDPGNGEQNTNNSTKDHSGYFPSKVKGVDGEEEIYQDAINDFNALPGYKNQTKVTRLLKDIQDIIPGSHSAASNLSVDAETYRNTKESRRLGNGVINNSGYCSRVTTNTSILLKTRIENNYNTNTVLQPVFDETFKILTTSLSIVIPGISYRITNYNACNKPLHDWYVNYMGYSRHIIGTNLNRKTTVNILNSKLNFKSGDIAIYWSNNPTSNGMWKYGHIQIYKGRQGSDGAQWSSDFNHSSFVYSGGESWSLVVLRAPNI